MYPTLFNVGPIAVDSYYLIWGIALCGAVIWMRARCVSLYGMTYDDASDILTCAIVGVLIGATIGGYVEHWRRYVESPIELLYFWRSGMSSGPGFLGGGLGGFYKMRRLGLKVTPFAEAASIPCAFMLAIGRWGCFLSGCCTGKPTDLALGVCFPFEPTTPRYPSQISESVAAFVIAIALVIVERARRRSDADARGALLWPAFLISYGAYRVVFDFMREGDRVFGFRLGQYFGAAAVVLGICWLVSARKERAHAR